MVAQLIESYPITPQGRPELSSEVLTPALAQSQPVWPFGEQGRDCRNTFPFSFSNKSLFQKKRHEIKNQFVIMLTIYKSTHFY